jgi:hypothetical protein
MYCVDWKRRIATRTHNNSMNTKSITLTFCSVTPAISDSEMDVQIESAWLSADGPVTKGDRNLYAVCLKPSQRSKYGWLVARWIPLGDNIRFYVASHRWLPKNTEPDPSIWREGATFLAEDCELAKYTGKEPEVAWFDPESSDLASSDAPEWMMAYSLDRTFVMHNERPRFMAYVPDDATNPMHLGIRTFDGRMDTQYYIMANSRFITDAWKFHLASCRA